MIKKGEEIAEEAQFVKEGVDIDKLVKRGLNIKDFKKKSGVGNKEMGNK